MKFSASIPLVSVVVLFVSLTTQGKPQTVELPKFEITIDPTASSPKFTITNASAKTVTACYIETSSSSENRKASGIGWDALVQSASPLEPGASFSMPLGHVVGGPIPDQVEVVAGIFSDGETFGRPELVEVILRFRDSLESAYDEAISLLRQGLDEHWTRDQFLSALSSKRLSGPMQNIRSNLMAKGPDERPRMLRLSMRTLLEWFSQKRDILRKAKPIHEPFVGHS